MDVVEPEVKQCRVCWGDEEDDRAAGNTNDSLISACNCTGSVQYIHRSCLQAMIATRGGSPQARRCELCHAPYHAKYLDTPSLSPMYKRPRRPLLQILRTASWRSLAVSCFRYYMFSRGVITAANQGVAGFKTGLGFGFVLVELQARMFNYSLSTLAVNIGLARIQRRQLWVQALTLVAFGVQLSLAPEVLYLSLCGLACGSVYGFSKGYLEAARSPLLAARSGLVAAGAVSKWLLRTVRGAVPGLLTRVHLL